jgi:hypothetical protein
VFHADVLPRLLIAMDDNNKETQERCCYSIEHFLENLGFYVDSSVVLSFLSDTSVVQSYLSQTMDRLLAMTHQGDVVHAGSLHSPMFL